MDIQHSVLPTGLNVITCAMPGFTSASVAAIVNAGARHERASENGVAHFLEHMAFKGTRRRTALDIARTIEDAGTDINAFTSRSVTAYHTTGLGSEVGLSIDVLGDVLVNSVFNERELEIERGVILQEIARGADDPVSVAGDAFSLTAYPDHPLGRPITGPADIIRQMGRQNFQDFVARHYVAANMVVVATGNVEHAAICDMTADAFAGLPSDRTAPLPDPARYVGGVACETTDKFEQVTFYLGLESVGHGHPDQPVHAVLASALGSGMSSPLFQTLREEHGLVYATGAFTTHESETGLFGVYAGTTPENILACVDLTCTTLADCTARLDPRDIERARKNALVRLSTVGERPMRLALFLGQRLLQTGRIVTPMERADVVRAISREQVMEAAIRVKSSPPTIALVGPVPSHDYGTLVAAALS